MTPAEANLHRIAEVFCAPRVVREPCLQCGGSGIASSNVWNQLQVGTAESANCSQSLPERCGACAGRGYIVTEQERSQ